jgi:hypothetical protein
MTFHVNDVSEDHSGHVTPNANITLAVLGGSVTSDGKVISFLTNSREYFLQPRRTYLLVLTYQPDQELFVVSGNWDITSGVVSANSSADRALELRSGSKIIGLTNDQLHSYLSKYLKNQR